MSYIGCPGNWSQGVGGVISCDTTATVITEVELAASLLSNNQLSASDFGVYFGAAVLILVTGYGIKLVRQLVEDRPSRGG